MKYPRFSPVFHSVVDSTFRHWTFKYLRCLSYFTVNIEHFLINFGMVYYAIAMYAIMWDNRVNEYFLHKGRHLSCDMTSSIITSLSILNLKTWGVDSPVVMSVKQHQYPYYFRAPNITDSETHSKFPFNLASHCTYSNPATQVGTQNKNISAVSQTDVTRILLPSVWKDAKVHWGVNTCSFK